MLRLRCFNLAPVVLRAMGTGAFYRVDDPVVTPPVTPPPRVVKGGGWTRVTDRPRPRPRPALDFKFVASGGVVVTGAATALFDTQNVRARRNRAEEEWVIFGLPPDDDL